MLDLGEHFLCVVVVVFKHCCRKTGTTTIQWELRNSKQELKNFNVFVPSEFLGNHHFLVEYFTRDNSDMPHFEKTLKASKDLFANMMNEIENSTQKNIIISAESFAMIDEANLNKIKDYFPTFRIRVILYYRNPMAWGYSMYRQELRDFPLRTPISLSSYLFQAVPLDSPIPSYMAIFYKFRKVYGLENVKVVDYDGFIRNGVNIMDSFFSALNIRVDKSVFRITPRAESNAGLDREETYVRQMWRIFDVYCKSNIGCSTYNSKNHDRLKASSLVNTTLLGGLVSSFPTKCLHLDMLKVYSLALDKKFREDFGDVILYGDKDATKAAIEKYEGYCQLDIDAVLTSERERWNKTFKKQAAQLENDNIACL